MRINTLLLSTMLLITGPSTALADDFNTMDTVRYVLECMADIGDQNEQNLYTCTCRHDVIARELPFEVYERAIFFERYEKMPGKRGGLVRDNKQAGELKAKLQAAREQASKECIQVTNVPTPEHVRADDK